MNTETTNSVSVDRRRIRIGQAFFVLFVAIYLLALITRKAIDYSFVLLVIAIGFFLIAFYEAYEARKSIQINKEELKK
jgi:asparagine N-glycosylation enzyme membrane subunit Stt3